MLCGFGILGSHPAPPGGSTTPATVISATEIRCASPPRPSIGAFDGVSVALNGIDFEQHSHGTTFPAPPPVGYTSIARAYVNTTFPRSGPVAGGTYVRVLGGGFVNGSHNWVACKFGSTTSEGTLLPLERLAVEGGLPRETYDAALADGQDSVIGCELPPAHRAGVITYLSRKFDHAPADLAFEWDELPYDPTDPTQPAYWAHWGEAAAAAAERTRQIAEAEAAIARFDELLGSATIEDRTLVLTPIYNDSDAWHPLTGRRYPTRGLPKTIAQGLGSILFGRNATSPAATVHYWQASFEILMSGAGVVGGGHGLCFLYGPVPYPHEPFGEAGTARGLNVHLLTTASYPFHQTLKVSYDGATLYEQNLGRAEGRLRTETWTNLTVAYGPDGLQVYHAGRRRVLDLPIYGYSPTAEWYFGVGARAPFEGDAHRIDNFRLRSADLLTRHAVPMAVTLNGQDYVGVTGGFSYYTPPVASSVAPASGPTDGSTSLTFRGFGIGLGSQTECRVAGVIVYATAINETAVTCTTPPAGLAAALAATGAQGEQGAQGAQGANGSTHAYADVPIQLSLNGQWDPPSAVPEFSYRLREPVVIRQPPHAPRTAPGPAPHAHRTSPPGPAPLPRAPPPRLTSPRLAPS